MCISKTIKILTVFMSPHLPASSFNLSCWEFCVKMMYFTFLWTLTDSAPLSCFLLGLRCVWRLHKIVFPAPGEEKNGLEWKQRRLQKQAMGLVRKKNNLALVTQYKQLALEALWVFQRAQFDVPVGVWPLDDFLLSRPAFGFTGRRSKLTGWTRESSLENWF